MIPPEMVPRDGTASEPEERPRIPSLILGFGEAGVCFLRSFCLGQTWFGGLLVLLYTEIGGMGTCPFLGGLGAAMASLGARLGSTVALPRHSGILLAAPHISWQPHHHPGAVGWATDGFGAREPPWPARSRRLCRPWELFGAKPLHNPCAVVSPPVTGCSQAQQGAGSDLKKENFPIHTQPDARDVWHRTRMATGTLGEATICPR